MITEYGMSEKLGPRTFGNKQEMVFLGREISEQRDYGDKIANLIDEEVHELIEQAYETAKKILLENQEKLKEIAEKLISLETLEGEDLEKLFNGLAPAGEEADSEAPAKTEKKKKAAPKDG